MTDSSFLSVQMGGEVIGYLTRLTSAVLNTPTPEVNRVGNEVIGDHVLIERIPIHLLGKIMAVDEKQNEQPVLL